MGAGRKSVLKKCGEILINIKAKNKKNKIYTFTCVFCEANCDQLKKFSIHLEEKHLQEFLEEESEDKTVIYVPEIKKELKSTERKDNLQSTVCLPQYEDPLETIDPVKEIESSEMIMDMEIKEEEVNEPNFDMDYEDNDFNKDDMLYQDCLDNDDNNYSDGESSGSEYKVKTKLRKRKKVKVSEKKKGIKFKSKGEQAKKRLKISEENTPPLDEKELCVALLKAFKKQTILWKVKERAVQTSVTKKFFEIVANEVNEQLKSNITLEDAKMRITKMRKHYTAEMQKKKMEEHYELPWYAEHMEFLHENIKALLKGRKTMDESELSLLVDIYKKYDSLWQVTNIGFGAKRIREQEFKKIVDELNLNHNLNINEDDLHRRVSYMLRLYSENKKLQLECELKKRKFKPTTSLYEKMSFLSDGHGPFKCSECNEIIKRYDNYRVHVAKHNDSTPFPCPLCKRSFNKYSHYIIHARRHLDLNNYFCKFCDRGFPNTVELALHERSHTGENPYLCQICGATFRAANGYDNHMRRHENRFRYECHICNHGFNHVNALNDHVKAHLNIRDIVCNICSKTFTSKKRLKNHQYIHSEEKRYKCKDCGKEFAQNAGLRQHRKQHQPFAAERKKESSLNFDIVPIDFFK